MITEPSDALPGPTPVEIGTSIELFTGGGGLALAMHRAGFRHLVAVEIDKRACATLRTNMAEPYAADKTQATHLNSRWPLIEGDIHGVDFTAWQGEVDVIAGGVPCQPWSLGGVHKGYDDPRNLWPELFRVVRETRPRAVIAENVHGLLRASFRPYYDYILNELRAPFEQRVEGEEWFDHNNRLEKTLAKAPTDPTERYDVTCLPINAADYGVPQIRRRVFVVAFRQDLGLSDWKPPEPTHSEAELVRAQASGRYWDEHEIARPVTQILKPPLPPEKPILRWRTLRDAIKGNMSRNERKLPEPEHFKVDEGGFLHHYGWPGAREYKGHKANELDRPARTVKAGVHGVPGGETVLRKDDGSIRYMTVREVARVMTFPDDWQLAGPRGEQVRQLGNAVPVDLGEVIAKSVATALASKPATVIRP